MGTKLEKKSKTHKIVVFDKIASDEHVTEAISFHFRQVSSI